MRSLIRESSFLTRQTHGRFTLLRVAVKFGILALFSLSLTHGYKNILLDSQVCFRVPPVIPRTQQINGLLTMLK
jgi:hypothetical protein